MKTSLTDILINALIGKKIKLYKVLEKNHNPSGLEYYLTDEHDLPHPKKCKIIGETHGFIKSIDTSNDKYDGDYYDIMVVDDAGIPIHVNGLNSITCNLEIIK